MSNLKEALELYFENEPKLVVNSSQKGSHIKLRGLREEKLLTVIVPNDKVIAKGTFSSILRQAEMTRKEFENYL